MKAEGHSADTGAGKFPLVSMGGRAEGLACADPGARTPIGASGISLNTSSKRKRGEGRELRAIGVKTKLFHLFLNKGFPKLG